MKSGKCVHRMAVEQLPTLMLCLLTHQTSHVTFHMSCVYVSSSSFYIALRSCPLHASTAGTHEQLWELHNAVSMHAPPHPPIITRFAGIWSPGI
jgi:hypothetical protein